MNTVAHPAVHPQLALRNYQLGTLTASEAALERGVRRQLVALPTGTGKTVIFVELVRRRGGRALVLVHRDELIQQTIEKLALVGLTDIGMIKGELDEVDRRVIVASVQTLARPNRLARVVPNFTTIVVDEAHHATADSYRRVLAHLGAFEDTREQPLVLGVTATAERADGTALGDVFQEIVFERTLLDMIRQQYLVDLRAVQVRLAVDFHDLHTRAGDFIDRDVEDRFLAADAPQQVAAAYLEHARGRRAIVFTSTVRLAQAMAEAFRDVDVVAETVDGGMALDARRDSLARFKAGDIQVLTNCAVLTEGYDHPAVDCVVIARPTKSRPLYVQMIGRGTRRFPGKADCLILDMVGATTRHDLVTAASLFGLEPAGTIEGSVIDAVAERETVLARQAHEGELVAQRVDLFRQRPLGWVTVNPSYFVLTMGAAGDLDLRHEPDGWMVVHRYRDGRREVLTTGLSIDYAMGAGEDIARRLGPAILLAKDARWRRDPATERQLEYLRRRRIPFPPRVTKGAATDLIVASQARRFA